MFERAVGDEIAAQKMRNVEIFQETLAICRAGEYVSEQGVRVKLPRVEDVLAASVWYERPPRANEMPKRPDCQIDAVCEDCVLVTRQLKVAGFNPVMLNMASRRCPGGGVLTGSRAQEESLCRQSNLVVSLYSFEPARACLLGLPLGKGRYPMNRHTGAIYSGRVTFFRSSVRDGYRLLDEPFDCSVVSVAGINRPDLDADGRLTVPMAEGSKMKMRSILRVGLLHGHDAIVLGALGCGAFHNPPDHIAELFRDVLAEDEFRNKFRCVRFAVLEDHNSHNRNFSAFDRVFNSRPIEC